MKAVLSGIMEFVVTNRCNFRCAHCYGNFGENDESELDMTRDEVFGALKEFYDAPCDEGVKTVEYFGGEPTLHPDILTFIEMTSRLKMMPILTTNAWWGFNAHDYVKHLKEAAVGAVALSCDIYHLEFNTWENLKSAYDELANAGIMVCFNWTSDKFRIDKNKTYLLTDAIKELKPFIPVKDIYKYLLKTKPHNFINLGYLGRAKNGLTIPRKMWDMKVPGVGQVVNVHVLPGYKISLNCTYDMPFSLYDYKPGELIKTITEIQEWKEANYPKMDKRLIRCCEECNMVMMKVLGRDKINIQSLEGSPYETSKKFLDMGRAIFNGPKYPAGN